MDPSWHDRLKQLERHARPDPLTMRMMALQLEGEEWEEEECDSEYRPSESEDEGDDEDEGDEGDDDEEIMLDGMHRLSMHMDE